MPDVDKPKEMIINEGVWSFFQAGSHYEEEPEYNPKPVKTVYHDGDMWGVYEHPWWSRIKLEGYSKGRYSTGC